MSGDAPKARAALWPYGRIMNVSAPGSLAWMCLRCSYSPGASYGGPPNQRCGNCKADLFVGDNPSAPPSETECLAMQVYALRHALKFESRLARALGQRIQTGEMPSGYDPSWPDHAAKRTDAEIDDSPRMTESWKAYLEVFGVKEG